MPAYPALKKENMARPGYSIEVTPGVDPATARLAIPGLLDVFEPQLIPTKDHAHGPSTRDTIKGWMEYLQFRLHIEYQPFDEFSAGANSLLAMALGAAPSGADGTIALLDNLRTATWQWGTKNVRATTVNEWRRARYCIEDKWTLFWANGKPTRVHSDWRGIHDPSVDEATGAGQAPFAAEPSEFAGSPYLGSGAVTVGISGQTVNGTWSSGSLTVENSVEEVPEVYGAGAYPVARALFNGDRDVYGTLGLLGVDLTALDVLKADPVGAAGQFGLTLTLSKNAAAQFIKLVMATCQLEGDDPGAARIQRDRVRPEPLDYRWRCIGAIAADVKTP